METPTSGFISFTRNHTDDRPAEKIVSVPVNYTVVVSFKEDSSVLTDVTLFRHYINFHYKGPDGKFRISKAYLWRRLSSSRSDFAKIFQGLQFSIIAKLGSCKNGTCFRLFFSFFPDSKRPLQSPHGVWNCSVKHYASFHHHLACNLKTECEDGRDETGDCPYSSPQCNGLLALCNRCYRLIENFRVSKEEDRMKKANEYCGLTESHHSVPVCSCNLIAIFRHKTKLHPYRLGRLLVDVHSNDISVPKMYRHALIRNKRIAMHHFWCKRSQHQTAIAKACFSGNVDGCTICIKDIPCVAPRNPSFGFTLMCEHTRNKTATTKLKTILVSNVTFSLSSGLQDMTTCPDGHITYTLFLCGSDRFKMCGQQTSSPCMFSSRQPLLDISKSSDHRISSVATFTCEDVNIKISYSLVCDFVTDCHDKSDESFCKYSPCIRIFRCHNGECVPFEKTCDNVFHCQDKSDEENCARVRTTEGSNNNQAFPSPALVRFNGVAQFFSTQMKSNESCPDTHYRCPGDFNDCLPIYTWCNDMYDCIEHQDEEGCENIKCPGHFQCRLSTICLRSDHVCDGWPHCPVNDDELFCSGTCPAACLCQGYTFCCPQPFSAALFPQLRYLDATGSGLTLHDVSDNPLLIGVVLAQCALTSLPRIKSVNLRVLDLSGNQVQYVNLSFVLGLESLHTLSLSNNPLSHLYADYSSGDQHTGLTVLHLAHTALRVLDTTVLSPFPRIQTLNLTFTSIHTISPVGFLFTPQLRELYMDNSPVESFPLELFQSLLNVRFISAQNYRVCCSEILPHYLDSSACCAPKDEISSCKDLLQSWTYRGFLWLIACLSLTGNAFCCCARLLAKSMASSSGYSVFVTNLAMADFLMGVYIAAIGVADERFRGQYFHKDYTWKNSATCQVAGFLSFLSSEVSVLIIWLITLDRSVVISFPFSSMRFGRTSAAVSCLLNWLVGWCLALLPLLPMTSHWEFYSQTGLCIPLPVTRQNFKGKLYSVGVLIIFNFVLFVFIAGGQAFIYWSVKANTAKMNSTRVSRDMTIARRLITIAVTDFLCWFPIGVCGMLALGGIPVPGEMSVALAIFVLPLNSAVNPFMYTFNTLAEKRRKADESKLLKWLESHPDLIIT